MQHLFKNFFKFFLKFAVDKQKSKMYNDAIGEKMERKEIQPKDTAEDIILKMAEGVPGASVLLSNVVKTNISGWFRVMDLDSMNIRGSQIWLGYKDYCGENLDLFWDCVKKHDEKMIEAINILSAKMGDRDKAVKNDGDTQKDKLFFSKQELEKLKKQTAPVHPEAAKKQGQSFMA